MKSPNKVGGGAQTNVNGLHFEQTTDLHEVLSRTKGFEVKNQVDVHSGGEKVGMLCGKHDLYRLLLEPKGIDYRKIISKKLVPDDAMLVKKTVYIIEKKFQSGAGSVDEKLQTCDFKKKQYEKLLSRVGLRVEYVYVLSDWFKQACYKDVHQYILDSGCRYYFNEIPLDLFGW